VTDTQISEVTTTAPETTAAPEATVTERPKETFEQTMDRVAREVTEGKRGPDGKFQSRVVAPGAPETPELPGAPPPPAPEPAQQAIEAPQSLPDDVKKVWTELPPAHQQWLAKREGEIHKKITADGERLKALSAFEEVLKPLDGRLRQVNAPAHEYVRRLAAADQLLATNGVEGLRQIAQMYGIDVRSLLQQPTAQPNQAIDIDSKVQEGVQKALQELRVSEKASEIDKFRTSLPEAERADFDRLESAMTGLAMVNPKQAIADLYKSARRADPELYAKDQAAAKEEADKKAAEEAKKRQAADAKIAPFAKRPGAAPVTSAKPGSIWDTMDRVASDIRARG
jgi:hypothetical protein